jgi:hypothetical protein
VNTNLIDVSSVRADVIITTQDNVLVDFVIPASSSGMPDPTLYVVQGGGRRVPSPRSDPPPSATLQSRVLSPIP